MTLLPSQLLAPAISHRGSGTRHIALGQAGRDPIAPSYVFLCFDDSGSLTSGHDPVGARYTEAARALTHVGAAARTDTQQVALYRFDHPHVTPIGPLPLHKRSSLRTLVHALRPPADSAGASTLAPAMTAMNTAAELYPDADRMAVVFSDFELLDPGPSRPYDTMAAFPGIVHAVVMNAIPPPELCALDNVVVTHVTSADPPGRLAAALAHTLTRTRHGATPARLVNEH